MGAADAWVHPRRHRPVWNADLVAEARLPGLAAGFAAAHPFPHLVIDNLFDANLLREILGEFDGAGADTWETYDNPRERKQGSRSGRTLPPATQCYFDHVNSGPFLSRVAAITGVDNLIVDATIFGGGMHQMREGDFFAPHLDFQQHPYTGLDNRAVLITFLCEGWREEFGGLLELWGSDPEIRDTAIVPAFNRTVVFLQTPHSVHGVARVLSPPTTPRRSLAAYYYSNGGVGERRIASTTTIFVRQTGRRLGEEAKWLFKRIAPPIVVDAVRSLRRRF